MTSPSTSPSASQPGPAQGATPARPTTVTVLPTGELFTCRPGAHALEAIAKSGRRPVGVGCRQGGCGACRVRVLSGTYTTKVMSKAYCSADDIEHGVVLACRIFPTDDLVIEPCPKQRTTP